MGKVAQISSDDARIERHTLEFGAARAIDAALMILEWNENCWGENASRMRNAALACVACARDNLRKLEGGH